MGQRARAGIIVNNLLPAAGVVFLGWETSPVLLLFWLDDWLGVWEVAAAACRAVAKEEPPVLAARIQGVKRALFWIFTYLLVLLLASLPSLVVWMGLTAVTQQSYGAGLLSAAFAQRSILVAVGLNVLLRVLQGVVGWSRLSVEPVVFTIEEKYHLVVFKTLAMFMLATYVGGSSRVAIVVFIVLVSVFFAWAELHSGRVLHLLKVGSGSKPADPAPDQRAMEE